MLEASLATFLYYQRPNMYPGIIQLGAEAKLDNLTKRPNKEVALICSV